MKKLTQEIKSNILDFVIGEITKENAVRAKDEAQFIAYDDDNSVLSGIFHDAECEFCDFELELTDDAVFLGDFFGNDGIESIRDAELGGNL